MVRSVWGVGLLALPLLGACLPDTRWLVGSSGGGDESGRHVDHDGSGAAFVTGGYSREANLGGGPLAGNASGSIRSPFLAKYDAQGRHVWSRGFASGPPGELSPSTLHGPELAVAWEGASTLFMYVPGEVDLDGLRVQGQVLARFAPDGRAVWAQAPPAGVSSRWGAALASNSQGWTLVGAARGQPATSPWPERAWVALYSGAGALQWERDLPGNVAFDGAAFDTQDHPYVAGVQRREGGGELVVLRLDRRTGATVWEQRLALGPLQLDSVELTATGERVLVGFTMRSGLTAASFTFAGQTFTFAAWDVEAGRSEERGLLLAFDRTGAARWARQAGAAVNSVSAAGPALVVLGRYTAGQDLGTGPLPSEGPSHVYLARYGADAGDIRWAEAVLGTSVVGRAVDLAPDGTSTAVGQYRGTARFGDEVLTAAPASGSSSDAWLWRRAP